MSNKEQSAKNGVYQIFSAKFGVYQTHSILPKAVDTKYEVPNAVYTKLSQKPKSVNSQNWYIPTISKTGVEPITVYTKKDYHKSHMTKMKK
jgi:hypothetical protein